MSLNGLDDPTVIEAYQTALAEAGGWFLLKYVGRDEIALLGRGTGGVTEIRVTIEAYDENSPLYGFLQYRRRKLVLRYMPEGLSRLLQARTTVQFQSVLDKFSPHDTVFSLAAASELTESALSSACLLHAASGSMTSSSSSLRRRRLMEITEDAEENGTSKEEAQTQSPDSNADRRKSVYSQLSEATAVPSRPALNLDESPHADRTSPRSKEHVESPLDRKSPPASWEHSSEHSRAQRHLLEQLSQPIYEPRKSSQSTRPSLHDLEQSSLYRPKVKLGPRPSMDVNGRPRTAGGLSRERETRPIASLPAGVRLSTSRRPNSNVPRPKSQPGSILSTSAPGRVPPVPPLLVPLPSLSIMRPQLSPGARSLTGPASAGRAPEKERLMKALQMRKEQMKKRAEEKNKEQMEEEKGNSMFDATEDKENIGISQGKGAQGLEQQHVDTDSIQCKEPLFESRQVTAVTPIEPHGDTTRASLNSSKPDSAVDILVAGPDSSQLSSPTTPVVSATIPPVPDEPRLQTPEVVQKEGDLAVSVQKETEETPKPAATGLGLSVAVTPQKLSDEVNAVDTPTTVELTNSTEGEVRTPTLVPETFPLPDSPSRDSRSSLVPTSSQAASSEAQEVDDDTMSQDPEAVDKEALERRKRRKAMLDPIQVVSGPEYSDEDNLLSDDSFMEELKSATVQEAKPISVAKSPMSPIFSSNGECLDAWRNPRAVSNPGVAGHSTSDLQALPVGRSTSGPYFDSNSAVPVLVAKKVNVSSGISKRIKALEKFSSSREPSSSTGQSVVPTPSTSTFERFRKRASISLAGGAPASTPNPKSTPYITPSPSPEAVSKAPSPSRQSSLSASSPGRGKPNSVSVTARIVRDPNAPPSDPAADPSEPSVLNLQRSPLIVESDSPVSPRPSSPPPASATNNKLESRSMSISSVGSRRNSFAAMMPRSESRLSVSSRSKADGIQSRSTSDLTSSPESRKDSRTSRIIRRMSSITSTSRRSVLNALSPTLKEEEAPLPPEKDEDLPPEPPQVVDIGEVNVQFPDTLLWKRRFMRIDDHGYLILTPGNVDSSTRNIIKRYHLSEFNTPCLPDQDRQELPNSIVLDFRDGNTLQCACESRQGQAAVLQTLVDAHNAYQQMYT